MSFHHIRLKNGLQILGETNPSNRSVAVGFFVKTGARDEQADVAGVSHFLEHMVFKGTPKRSAFDVNREFDSIGANYNAYTSEENTVFHAQILPEYLPQAVDILADILRPSLRTEDFDTEKKVIIEEIGMYDDQPMYMAYDTARSLFFANHALGTRILGTVDTVGALSADQMRAYFNKRYVASNITIVATGNFDFPAFLKLVEERCESWPAAPAPRDVQVIGSPSEFQLIQKDSVQQQHTFMFVGGPPGGSEWRYAANCLVVALGDDTGSRLHWALVDPGDADAAGFDYQEYQGAGAFGGYLGGDATKAEANLRTYIQVLSDVQAGNITEEELQVAKAKLASRVVRGNEKPMGRMSSIGFNWNYLGQYRTADDDLAAVDAVTLQDIRRMLDAYPITRPTIVTLGPLKEMQRPF